MYLQIAAVEEANEWFVVGALFGAIVGPLLVLRYRRSRRIRLGGWRRPVLAPPAGGPLVEAESQDDVIATAGPQRTRLSECDAEGYPTSLGVQELPAGPPMVFLREASVGELTAVRRAAPPRSFQQIARERWLGRWVRWGGTVREIAGQGDLLTVMVVDSRGGFVYLNFPLRHRTVVDSLREGDRIAFTGQIHELSDMCAGLVRVDFSVRRPNM